VKTNQMTSSERLYAVMTGGMPDRPPVLGGWIANPALLAEVSGVTMAKYREDPVATSISAYRKLGTDGVLGIFVPKHFDDFRCVDHDTYNHAEGSFSLEETVAFIDRMPGPDEFEKTFDYDGEYDAFKKDILFHQAMCGDMQYIPPMWGAGAKVTWYQDFGYENYFMIIGLYPDSAEKLMEVGGARGRCMSKIIVRAVKDGIYPPAVLLGEDICTQRGPMISPEFLERYYAPQLEYGLEPLLEAGIKPVWHCDGDVRPMLDMLIACGVRGLQGFQPECGMNIDFVASKRTREGNPLLIYGPLAVTTELPVCTPLEIRKKVRHAIDVCKGNADLVFFTSNTINPDIPLENLIAMYEAIQE
jgi:hypothetical protein